METSTDDTMDKDIAPYHDDSSSNKDSCQKASFDKPRLSIHEEDLTNSDVSDIAADKTPLPAEYERNIPLDLTTTSGRSEKEAFPFTILEPRHRNEDDQEQNNDVSRKIPDLTKETPQPISKEPPLEKGCDELQKPIDLSKRNDFKSEDVRSDDEKSTCHNEPLPYTSVALAPRKEQIIFESSSTRNTHFSLPHGQIWNGARSSITGPNLYKESYTPYISSGTRGSVFKRSPACQPFGPFGYTPICALPEISHFPSPLPFPIDGEKTATITTTSGNQHCKSNASTTYHPRVSVNGFYHYGEVQPQLPVQYTSPHVHQISEPNTSLSWNGYHNEDAQHFTKIKRKSKETTDVPARKKSTFRPISTYGYPRTEGPILRDDLELLRAVDSIVNFKWD